MEVRPGIDLAGKRVLVVGLARTGVVASLFSAGYGASVTATDAKPESQLAEAAARLRAAGVKLALGPHDPAIFLEQDLIVLSPGVPAQLPALEAARARGIPVWSEIELAWRFLRGKLVAITGSNGKTTTTSLVAHILKTSNIHTLVGGNIGVPLLALVESSTDSSVTVAEISSFQLETIAEFRPEIGVLLNLTPDHLDRHASFEEYAAAKMRMFENQLDRDAAVLNADDPEVARRMPSRPHVYWFSRQKRVVSGAFLRDGQIVFRADGSEIPLSAPYRNSSARRTQPGKCAGGLCRGTSRRRRSRRNRGRREDVSRRGAPPRVRRSNRRRCFLQRFQSDQRGCQPKSDRSVSRATDRHSGRQRQGRTVCAIARASAPAGATRGSDRRRGRKNQRQTWRELFRWPMREL